MAEIPVNPIEEKDGVLTYNLSSSATNDDWLASARLLREGKQDEFDAEDKIKMVRIDND